MDESLKSDAGKKHLEVGGCGREAELHIQTKEI